MSINDIFANLALAVCMYIREVKGNKGQIGIGTKRVRPVPPLEVACVSPTHATPVVGRNLKWHTDDSDGKPMCAARDITADSAKPYLQAQTR